VRGFRLSDDQQALQGALRDFLSDALPAERAHMLMESETGRSPELWAQLAELGVVGLTVPEEHGGLGFGEVEITALLEEAGYALLSEPLASTAAVGVPLLLDLGVAGDTLAGVAAGDASLAVGLPSSPFVADAHVATTLLLAQDGELHAVAPASVSLTEQESVDRSRRLFTVDWSPSPASELASGDAARSAIRAAEDRAVLACSAELLGVARRLIDEAVGYARDRRQFGQPIGAFQAVKHLLADALVQLEFARPVVYYAAASLAARLPDGTRDASMAKIFAANAGRAAARAALQVHGAVGYTWEHHLHLWLLHAEALERANGGAAEHRARLAERLLV
jgi:alkylation response protein AidB-like acyl-CoA dehydrogenase